MKSILYIPLSALIFALNSCGYESPKYKALRAQADSISMLQQSLERDLNEYIYIFNEIDNGIDRIKNKKATQIIPFKTKLSEEENAKVINNIAKINSLLQTNQGEVDELKKQIRHNSFKAKSLQNEIDSLALLLEKETMKINALQNEKEEKDYTLALLEAALDELNKELEDTKKQLAEQKELIAKHEEELFTGYYITGSKAELKNKKILTKSGLFKTLLFQEEVNPSNFTKINILETNEIKLPDFTQGKVLSTHPRSSYKLTKKGNEKIIQILNPEKFWSVTKYLVIQ